MFTLDIINQINWYVYALRDPCTNTIFYIGKGKGNRVFQHASDALDKPGVETEKLDTIRRILASGREVESFIIRHGIATATQAYAIEAAVIDALRLGGHKLQNVAAGHGHRDRGLVHTSVLTSVYSAPVAPTVEVPTVLVRISRLWTPQMTPSALYEAASGWWRMGKKRARVKIAFAVSAGVVRAVYRVTSWRQRARGDREWEEDIGRTPRWAFNGEHAHDFSRYLNTSVAHLFKRGQSNPVRYMNCD